MSEQLRRLIPQAKMLITKESFRDHSFGSLDGYIKDILRPIDLTPLIFVVHRAMSKFPRQSEESDGWLAPRVHASLRLYRSEAADQGIWDYLSVAVLPDYVVWRMAGDDGSVNDADRIIGPFRHQALARLWWAAELSRNGADYRPTEQAFSSQDAVNYLTNVDAFHNRPAALAYIRFISHKSGEKPIKQRAIETGKTLNHVLTTIVLDSFAPDSGSDMNAQAQWIAEAPDIELMDSVLPMGPNEPEVPEEKIYAVEQMLERLMEEHRWHEVVDWSDRWIAELQSPKLAETASPPVESPGGNGSKKTVAQDFIVRDVVARDLVVKEDVAQDFIVQDVVARDLVAQDAVLYERFAKALQDDMGVEPSDRTRKLFEKMLNEPDRIHKTRGSTSVHRAEGLSKDDEIVGAMAAPAPALTVSADAVSVRGDKTPKLGEPLLAAPTGSGDAQAPIVETAENLYEKLSPEQQTVTRRIVLQLTELGEGRQDAPRHVAIKELILRPKNTLPVDAMLEMLSDALDYIG